jgi:CHAT domain-containing protein
MEEIARRTPRVLALAHSDAEGLLPLPHARTEMEVIHQILPPDAFIDLDNTQDPPASAHAEILSSRLQEATVLHLACHAHQDHHDPLESGFDLPGGRLTLSQLMKLNLPEAQLAYLSACESAAVDENQPDEAMNLAATMLFVGFKSVVATMW